MASMIRNFVSGLSDREKKLALAMIAMFALMIFSLAIFFVRSNITDLEIENQALEEALQMLDEGKAEYLAQKRNLERARRKGLTKPTPLRTLIDKIGKELGVVVPDIKEFPNQQHGTRWVEHSAELSIRDIGLATFTKFMEEVEANRRRFPVAITKLEIRKRRRTTDQYDVKMTISTYEQSAPAPGSDARGGKAGKGGR